MLEYLEESPGANLHMEHLEDEILNFGIDGGRASINFLQSMREMLKGTSTSRVNMTVKWDGAPAIFAGNHPETGKFFVAKKSLFNKTPLFYTSEQEIKDDPKLSGQLESKFLDSFKYLSKLNWPKILQGDLMFTNDKSSKSIDGVPHITFQPNTILYAVPKDSDLGKQIDRAKLGIVFHTTYTGDSIEGLSASFGANIKPLGTSPDIWMDDATYKDVSGTGSMTKMETVELTGHLSNTGKSFRKIKTRDLNKFLDIQKAFAAKGAVGSQYKTYMNAMIRGGTFNPTTKGYMEHVDKYWEEKIIAKAKGDTAKKNKTELKNQFLRDLRSLKNFLEALVGFQSNLVKGKQLVINVLNRVKGIGTFVVTDNGFEVTNPEGYVAIAADGSAVKLVDRLEFSKNNFNVAKNWTK